MRVAFLVLLSLAARGALAFDVGDPTFPGLDGPSSSFEIVFESMSRDVWLGLDRQRLGTPATGQTAVAIDEPLRQRGTDSADIILGRWVHRPIEFVSTQLDLGFLGESTAGDTPIVFGGAVKMLLTESWPFQLVTQFDAHFIPEFRTYDTGVSATRGPFTVQGDYDAYELGAALLGSMTTETESGYRLTVYGGPRLSSYRGEMRSFGDFANGERMWVDGIVKQASPFGVVIGTRLQWNETWSARVEGRLIEEQSLSFGLSATF